MTVVELIEWLKTQDQGAIVEVVVHTVGNNYYQQGGSATTAPFDPDKHVEYTDFRGNQFMRPGDSWYNQRILLLGVYGG